MIKGESNQVPATNKFLVEKKNEAVRSKCPDVLEHVPYVESGEDGSSSLEWNFFVVFPWLQSQYNVLYIRQSNLLWKLV